MLLSYQSENQRQRYRPSGFLRDRHKRRHHPALHQLPPLRLNLWGCELAFAKEFDDSVLLEVLWLFNQVSIIHYIRILLVHQ